MNYRIIFLLGEKQNESVIQSGRDIQKSSYSIQKLP